METNFLEYYVVELKTDKRNILLVSAYRSPNTNAKEFLKEYFKLVSTLRRLKTHKLIIGIDHNLDLLKSHQNKPTNDFIEVDLDKELIPCLRKPTRVTHKSATLIDNILVSKNLQQNYDSFIIIENISDHFACFAILKDQNKSSKGPKYIKTRNLDDTKINDIVTTLLQIDWTDYLGTLSANEGFNAFHSVVISTIDSIVPEVEIKLSKNRTARDHWITKGILNSICKQKKLYLCMSK